MKFKNRELISVSMSTEAFLKLERLRRIPGTNRKEKRSNFIENMILNYNEKGLK